MRFALVLSEAGSGLKRNLSMVISVVLVTFISLTFVGTAILMQMQIGQMKTYWYDRAQVAVYMCTETDVSTTCQGQDATSDQIAAVKAKLSSSALAPFIEKFYFENHKQAYADFKKQFAEAAVKQFGSGWAWLVKEGDKLKITTTGNAETPITKGATALITCDVWEHAYYIDYRNLRAKYVDTFLEKLVNWDFAAANFK